MQQRRDKPYLDAERWSPEAGESITGEVVRLPAPGRSVHHGLKLVLAVEGRVVLVDATARTGHTMVGRELRRQDIAVGERVRITFRGWRRTRRGAAYRRYELARVELRS